MDFTNFFFGAKPEPPVDLLGSTRFNFNNPSYLLNTDLVGKATGNYTISVWAKKTFDEENSSKFLLTSGSSGTNSAGIGYNNSGLQPCWIFRDKGGTTMDTAGSVRHTDTTGWYHLVCTNDSINHEQCLYVNGELVGEGSGSSANTIFAESPVQIGLYASSTYTSTAWDGLVSHFYFIDGKVLPPTTFGNFDANNVWVPVDPEFEVNTYKYSAQISADGGFTSNFPPKNIFDGTTTTYGSANGTGTITFSPVTPITVTDKLEVYNNAGRLVYSVGTVVDREINSQGTWNEVYVVANDGPLEISVENPLKIAMGSPATGNTAISGIRVDGVDLIDGPRYSADVFTGPSGNTEFDWTATGQNFKAGAGPEHGFDGNSGVYVMAQASNSVMWRPSTPITGVTSVEMFTDTFSDNVYGINSTEVTVSANSPVQPGTTGFKLLNLPAGFNGTLNNLGIRCDGSTSSDPGWGCIRINGSILIDGSGLEYGEAGFYLPLNDPTQLGIDKSGNGNHFQPYGLDTSLPGIWSNYVFTSPGDADSGVINWDSTAKSIQGGSPATNGFNQDTGTFVQCDANNTIIFRPESLYATKVEIFPTNGSSSGGHLYFNRVKETRAFDSQQWHTLYDGEEIQVESLGGNFTPSGGFGWASIRINGQYLYDNWGITYCGMEDSPTNNWALNNPLMMGIDGGTTNGRSDNGGLDWLGHAGSNTLPWVYASQRIPVEQGGKYYMETVTTSSGTTDAIGVSVRRPQGDGDWGSLGCFSWFQDSRSWIRLPDGSNTGDGNTPGDRRTGVAGYLVNCDVEPPTITFTLEGGNPDTYTFPSDYDPDNVWFGGNLGGADPSHQSFNFGQYPFKYAPEGITLLNTASLERAPILNGREHFQPILSEEFLPPEAGVIESYTTIDNTPSYSTTNNTSYDTAHKINDANRGGSFGCGLGNSTYTTTYTYAAGSIPNATVFSTMGGYPAYPADIITLNGVNYAPPTYELYELVTGLDLVSSTHRCQTNTFSGNISVRIDGIDDASHRTIVWERIDRVTMEPGTDMSQYSVGMLISVAEDYEVRGKIHAVDVANRTIDVEIEEGEFSTGERITRANVEILNAAKEVFPSGLWWIKDRPASGQIQMLDSVRGTNLTLECPAAQAETTYTAPIYNPVAWCWKAGDAVLTNTDGSITSTTSANKEGGFSIVSYTGNLTAGATVGHGLDKAPTFMIVKSRTSPEVFQVYHKNLTPGYSLVLSSNNGEVDYNAWNGTAPNDTVFTIGPVDSTNKSGDEFIAYCWHDVPGFCKTGIYRGNAQTNGSYVDLGFRPAMVLIKDTNVHAWVLVDSETYNHNRPNTPWYNPDTTRAELTTTEAEMDFLAGGFKLRNSTSEINNTYDYTYIAWAENPFSYPTCAR